LGRVANSAPGEAATTVSSLSDELSESKDPGGVVLICAFTGTLQKTPAFTTPFKRARR
jgi:hypothetical protein